MSNSTDSVSRRHFNRCLACALGAACLPMAGSKSPAVAQEAVVVDLQDPELAPLLELGGAVKIPSAEGLFDPVIVVRTGEHEITAFSSACTHWGCEVELPDESGIIECFCHGARYDIEGRMLKGPAESDLARVPAKVIWPPAATAVERESWGRVKGQRRQKRLW
ncbi:MAG: Rieske (2Fe-2S) protein [Candidatus Latescibacterota bacterium]|nr:Rieske (2Fe-2S) protein [Candidatus Latescibacterota bacterium]